MGPDYGDAQAILAAALAHAERKEVSVSVAVVDTAGFLVAFGRATGARPYTADVALNKAYTAIFMGRSSAEMRDLADKRPQFFDALKNLGARTLIPSPGGLPMAGGAIGVSGSPDPSLDVEIAEAGIAMLARAPEGSG